MTASSASAGYNAGFFITSTPSVSMTDEAMTNSGDNATFNVTNIAHQALDYSTSFTVQTEYDDVQTVSLTGSPNGGTFTLTFGGHTTSGIAYNAPASGVGSVQAALEALTGVGVGQVTVTGSAGGPWLVDWTGTLGYASQSIMTTSGASLTGGISPASHVAHTQTGSTWATRSSGFVINYAIGQVVFTTAYVGNNNTPACRIHAGHYFTIAFLGFANNIEIAASATALDVTAFTNPPSSWKTYIAGINGATVKCMTWWIDATYLTDLTNASILLFRVYPNQANAQRYQGFGVLTTDAIKTAVAAANSEELDFVVNGTLYYLSA